MWIRPLQSSCRRSHRPLVIPLMASLPVRTQSSTLMTFSVFRVAPIRPLLRNSLFPLLPKSSLLRLFCPCTSGFTPLSPLTPQLLFSLVPAISLGLILLALPYMFHLLKIWALIHDAYPTLPYMSLPYTSGNRFFLRASLSYHTLPVPFTPPLMACATLPHSVFTAVSNDPLIIAVGILPRHLIYEMLAHKTCPLVRSNLLTEQLKIGVKRCIEAIIHTTHRIFQRPESRDHFPVYIYAHDAFNRINYQ